MPFSARSLAGVEVIELKVKKVCGFAMQSKYRRGLLINT